MQVIILIFPNLIEKNYKNNNYKMSFTLIIILVILSKIISFDKFNEIPEFLDNYSNQTLEIGTSNTYLIDYKKETNIIFNIKEHNTYQINIHSINCDFKIGFEGEIINQINLDTYSLKLNDSNKNIIIKPLIEYTKGEEKENYEKRKCYLSINSLNINNPEVTIENKDDSVFYFKDYDILNISYVIKEFIDDSFEALFFRFNENSHFSVTIKGNNENIIYKKIYNSTYIFLDSDILNNYYIEKQNLDLNIIIKKNDNKAIDMYFKIIEKEMISILQKNALNYGFITTQTKYQYFYLEVFKEEEGELMLHNKRFYGELLAKVVTKDDINYTDIYNYSIYPKDNNIDSTYINYNPHSLKLMYNYKDTLNCTNGCYILITYKQTQSEESEEDYIAIGYEFTLLSRSWNYSDYNPQIVDIPFNEYLLGSFEKETINIHHYYSITIPEEIKKIIIQIEGNYIDCFLGEGRRKINTTIIKENDRNLNIINNKNVLSFNIKDLNFKDNRICFAIRSKDYFDNIFSFYYFRIIYVPKDEIIYFPIDSQFENLCFPELDYKTNLFYCNFIFSNKYNELSTLFSLSTFNQNEYSKIYIKIILKNGTIYNDFSEMFYIYYDDSDDFNNVDYFLFTFEFQNSEIKSIISSLYEEIEYYYPQIYSPQIFYIYYVDKICLFKVRNNYILMNDYIYGYQGYIEVPFLNNYNFPSYKNHRGTPFIIDINTKTKQIKFIGLFGWLFVMKLEYNMRNKGMIEIKSGESIRNVLENGYFPLYYYLKIKNEHYINIDVNIRLNSFDLSAMKNNFDIKGYILDEDTIKRKIDGEYIPLENPINGIYSDILRGGLLQVNQNKTYNNNYLLIEITNKDTTHIDSFMSLELATKEYYQEVYMLPAYKFIIETFDDDNNKIRDKNKYHICSNINEDEDIFIEISPEYNDVDIIFTNETNSTGFKCSEFNCTLQLMGGFKKYIIKGAIHSNIYFSIINPKKRKTNYMIRYYYFSEEWELSYNLSDKIDKKYIDSNDDNITLSITFEEIEIYEKGKKYESSWPFYYHISGLLYKKKESSEELLNTSSILNERFPLYENKGLIIYNSVDSSNFTLLFKNISRKDNFIYDLQIIVIKYGEIPIVEGELLTFTLEVNLTDIKLKEDKSNLWIILGPILGFIFLLIIAFFIIKYIRLKHANINLKEDLKSMAYSNDIQKNIINKEREASEKDSDYDSTFI